MKTIVLITRENNERATIFFQIALSPNDRSKILKYFLLYQPMLDQYGI